VGCGLSKAHIHSEVLVVHGNARTTVHGRKLIVARHRAGWRQAHIAAAMGVSRKCVRTWITRYQTEGEAGLVDRSSRPRTSPTRTPAEVEDRIGAAHPSPPGSGLDRCRAGRAGPHGLSRPGPPRTAPAVCPGPDDR
jgi:hypothetical protein